MHFRKYGCPLRGFLCFICLLLPPSETPSARRRCGWMNSSSTTMQPVLRPRGDPVESKCPCPASCSWFLWCCHPAVETCLHCFCNNVQLNANGSQKLQAQQYKMKVYTWCYFVPMRKLSHGEGNRNLLCPCPILSVSTSTSGPRAEFGGRVQRSCWQLNVMKIIRFWT